MLTINDLKNYIVHEEGEIAIIYCEFITLVTILRSFYWHVMIVARLQSAGTRFSQAFSESERSFINRPQQIVNLIKVWERIREGLLRLVVPILSHFADSLSWLNVFVTDLGHSAPSVKFLINLHNDFAWISPTFYYKYKNRWVFWNVNCFFVPYVRHLRRTKFE